MCSEVIKPLKSINGKKLIFQFGEFEKGELKSFPGYRPHIISLEGQGIVKIKRLFPTLKI